MSSLPSSSAPSDTPAELINKILNTQANEPDFNLSLFVAQIDLLLRHYDDQLQRKKKPIREKLGDLPSASEASNFAEQVSNNVQLIAKEIKEYSGNKHETSIKVLNAIGNVHWVAVGFLVVGAVLKIADTIEYNKEECSRLLKSMSNLSKIIRQLQELSGLQKELQDKLKESIQLIVEGAILCCSQKKRNIIKRMLKASDDKQELQQLSRDMDKMCDQLQLQISTSTLKALTSVTPPSAPMLNQDAVGLEEKIKEVIQLLDWDSDSRTAAVVVYGIGGSGKTTLADAVYYSLIERLQGWNHSKIILIQNVERYPKVEDRQSSILEELTATKHVVKDSQSGRQRLKEIIENRPIFLYIDNALYVDSLEELLPRDFTNAKKFRLLLTARENVSGVIESCGVESCKFYDIGSLSINAALQVLCKKIDRNKKKEAVLKDRPQVMQIAEKCSSCPLFLEVIGAYLYQRKNEVESYKRVLHSLEHGDYFSGSNKYNLDESRVLFSYEGLNPSAQEAFLDICSFFFDWEWQEVAWIVGDEEMESLQEGALIKREGEEIKIHDLILTAGRHKSKDNRFNDVKAFSVALKNKERVSQIKGVWLSYMEAPLHISAEELDAMSRSLRVFYMGRRAPKFTIMKGKCGEQFKELRFLHVGYLCNLPVNIFNLNQLRYLSIEDPEEDVVLSRSMKLPNLKVLRVRWSRWERNGRQIVHGIGEIAGLRSLKQLDLDTRNADGISQCFTNLHHLQRLRLTSEFTELPESLARLQSLQKLDLNGCVNLKQLPAGFGELTSLTELNVSDCRSLQELPCDLEKLTSLQSLYIDGCYSLLCLPAGLGNSTSLTSLTIYECSRLTCLPHNLGGLMSALGSEINFKGCSSLSELPEDICKHTMLTSISLRRCRKLNGLPSRFGELTCLQRLDVTECESLEELCNDFHLLRELRELNLENCKSLSCLPLGFGKLGELREFNEVWCISAVQEMYLKMQDSHNYVVELVWVPITGGNTWEEFERAAANAPWPVVPNPWLVDKERINSLTKRSLPCVCVVDEKGRISKKDAMPMIERWGLEAYPFSQDREDELTKAEWEAFKLNSLSTLQFVFPNLEDLSNKAKEMMDRGVMMLKLAPDSNCAFTMLEKDLLLFYVARRGICAKENENDVSPTLEAFSFSDIYSFWRDVKRSLQEDVSGMGTNERIVKLRRMVLALYSKKRDRWYRPAGEWEMRVVLVDGNGEMMISRRGMGVEAACDNEKDSKEKLVEDTKTRWRDGIIHPKHDMFYKHLLLKVWNPDNWTCVCGEERNAVYQCTECEKYVICEECEKESTDDEDDMW